MTTFCLSLQAEVDLQEIAEYIAASNPTATVGVLDDFFNKFNLLG